MFENIPVSDDKVTDEAARAPITLFDYSSSNPDDTQREPGLILTKEQLKNLKRYEIAALALPTDITDVINYLGYETGAGRGLEAGDFQKTFKVIHTHASQWNPLRVDLLSVGSRLQVFAGEMQIYGSTMEETYEEVRALNTLQEYNIKTLEDVRKLELSLGSKFPGINLDRQDKETISEFSYYLDEIFRRVKQREAEAIGIQQRLEVFSFQLSNHVAPQIKQKITGIDNNDLADQVKTLNEAIEARAKSIDEKTKEYKEAVKQALSSAAGLNIVGLAMSIYIGVEAEKIRKERDALRAQQERDIAAMRTKNQIIASLNRVRLDLQDLDLIVIDADIATKNLATVWNKLTIFIEQSSRSVDGINDALTLRRFMTQFRLVVNPWVTIEKNANELLAVFKQADSEFREEYERQRYA
jgi:hypothetical protein